MWALFRAVSIFIIFLSFNITRPLLAQNNSTQIKNTVESQDLAKKLDNLGLVYKNDNDPVLQELWMLGRYHGQQYWINSDSESNQDYESRRLRYGAQARLFKKMTVHAQAVAGADANPLYNGFTELWTQWQFTPEFALTVGQQKHRFTHDRNVSSRYLNYLERSMLTNMFGLDYTPAVTAQGRIKNSTYYTGIFSNATGQNMGEAFTDLNSGYSVIAANYLDLGSTLLGDSTTLHTTYIYSDANDKATNMGTFNNGYSAALILTKGHKSLVTEFTAGLGSDNGNAYGLNIQPSYFFNERFQIATRYQIAYSNSEEGLNPQRRYERDLDIEPGDLYQAAYLGFDYYIAKHRLKLMQGVEYSNMNGQDIWTTSLMFRFYFGPHSGGAFPMNQVLPLDYD
jgi:phosphate-selective porin OprO/OprP